MRTSVLIACFGLAAGALLWLVLEQDPVVDGARDLEEEAGQVAEPAPGTRPPLRAEEAAAVEVVGPQAWPRTVDEEESFVYQADPRFARVAVEREDDREWFPTGAEVLETLSHELGGKNLAIRFRDQATLDDFRARTWPTPVPSRFSLVLLLESCHEVGFRPVLRPDAIYLVRLEDR